MDMSIVEGEERTVNVNEVADYAAEIHKHLRDMEVCALGYVLGALNASRVVLLKRKVLVCRAGQV